MHNKNILYNTLKKVLVSEFYRTGERDGQPTIILILSSNIVKATSVEWTQSPEVWKSRPTIIQLGVKGQWSPAFCFVLVKQCYTLIYFYIAPYGVFQNMSSTKGQLDFLSCSSSIILWFTGHKLFHGMSQELADHKMFHGILWELADSELNY